MGFRVCSRFPAHTTLIRYMHSISAVQAGVSQLQDALFKRECLMPGKHTNSTQKLQQAGTILELFCGC